MVVGAGVGLVEQEHRAEQHGTGQQLVPHALQAQGDVHAVYSHLTGEEEGDEGTGDHKADRSAQTDILLQPEEKPAGQKDEGGTRAHGGGVLAQHQRNCADVQAAAAAQGIRDGAGHRHAGGIPQGDVGIGLGVAEHLLRPGHCRHGVAHSSGVEGIAAVAAKHLLADENTGQHRHNDHIPVHRGGHEQGDDEGKALVGKIPGPIHAAAQQGDQAVTQIAGEQRRAAEQQGPQTVQEAGHAEQRDGHKADVQIVPPRLCKLLLLLLDQTFIHGKAPLTGRPDGAPLQPGRLHRTRHCPPPEYRHPPPHTGGRWCHPRRHPLPAGSGRSALPALP